MNHRRKLLMLPGTLALPRLSFAQQGRVGRIGYPDSVRANPWWTAGGTPR